MEGGKEALLSPFYKGTNHIYKGSTLNLVDHLPKVPPPNITLRIKFQHTDRGKGTNIQSIVTSHLLFFFWVLLPFPSFPSFNRIMFLWFHFLLLVCFLIWLIFCVLWDFCFSNFTERCIFRLIESDFTDRFVFPQNSTTVATHIHYLTFLTPECTVWILHIHTIQVTRPLLLFFLCDFSVHCLC